MGDKNHQVGNTIFLAAVALLLAGPATHGAGVVASFFLDLARPVTLVLREILAMFCTGGMIQ